MLARRQPVLAGREDVAQRWVMAGSSSLSDSIAGWRVIIFGRRVWARGVMFILGNECNSMCEQETSGGHGGNNIRAVAMAITMVNGGGRRGVVGQRWGWKTVIICESRTAPESKQRARWAGMNVGRKQGTIG